MSWELVWQLLLLIGFTTLCALIIIAMWGDCRVDIERMKFHGLTEKEMNPKEK